MLFSTLNYPLNYIFSIFYSDVKTKSSRLTSTMVLLSAISGGKLLHIILADDDAEDREIFMDAIREVAPQVKVTVANNGQQLMHILEGSETAHPNLIFLDLNMPLKNGHECLEEIRSNRKLKHIPVIIYSTSTSREHIDETFRRGASFYMPKPDSFRDLKTLTSKILSFDWENPVKPLKEGFVLSLSHFK